MYGAVIYKGKRLADWQRDLRFMFSLGELYRMMKDGVDFTKLMPSLNENGDDVE